MNQRGSSSLRIQRKVSATLGWGDGRRTESSGTGRSAGNMWSGLKNGPVIGGLVSASNEPAKFCSFSRKLSTHWTLQFG